MGYINKPFDVSYYTAKMKRICGINSLKFAKIIAMLDECFAETLFVFC